jgi:threonyl-tRNA synthetase
MSLENIRHSFAHLLAGAVKRLYPDAKFGIGPTIEDGFYYDFSNIKIGEEDLPKIQKEMVKIAKQAYEFRKEEWDVDKAREYFKKEGAAYKLELIGDLEKEGEEKVGMVHMGDIFLDLCRGGHIENTKDLPLDAFKLTRVAGAYWRGDEKNPMLTRVYGVAFETKEKLDEYLAQQEEAIKRDHKKLGKQLELFTFSELVGSGLPLFTPKGTILWNKLQKFSETLKREAGYLNVHIPHITKPDLYRASGHLEKFKDDIFYVRGKDSDFILKPMNCPHHTQIYASSPHSYKDLPVRLYETTTAYRDEQAGELGGLTRVRSITTDDSHSFAREDQIEQEFDLLIKGVLKVVQSFDLSDYKIRLSLRDEKNKTAYLGDDNTWQDAQAQMEEILKKHKINYEKAEGESAFYGPKMDFIIKDSMGREWQISTIQLDLNMPGRFGLEYIDHEGNKKTPIMIHSAFLGSIERFMGILIEHYAGAFPFWLSPEQIWIVPVSEKFNDYARNVLTQVRDLFRVSIKEGNDTLGKKIREGQMQKVPYLIIVGEKEEKSKKISVRHREKGDTGLSTVKEFVKNVMVEGRG